MVPITRVGGISRCHQLGTMSNLPMMWAQFFVCSNPEAQPNTKFSKAMQHNPFAPTPKHKNKWERTLHMDGCYVVEITTILYPSYEGIVMIISKERKNIPNVHS